MSKRWTESLPCGLTNTELLERGEALALQGAAYATKTLEAKRSADGFKAELKDIESETSRLAMIVREKVEARPVYVYESRDFKGNRVDIVREDTGEVVRTRVMSEHERQMELIPTIEPEEPEAIGVAIDRERLREALELEKAAEA